MRLGAGRARKPALFYNSTPTFYALSCATARHLDERYAP